MYRHQGQLHRNPFCSIILQNFLTVSPPSLVGCVINLHFCFVTVHLVVPENAVDKTLLQYLRTVLRIDSPIWVIRRHLENSPQMGYIMGSGVDTDSTVVAFTVKRIRTRKVSNFIILIVNIFKKDWLPKLLEKQTDNGQVLAIAGSVRAAIYRISWGKKRCWTWKKGRI